MKTILRSWRKVTALQFGIILSLSLVILFIVFLTVGDHRMNILKNEYERYLEKIRLVQMMKSELLISAEAEKSAIMENMDDKSRMLAEQSLRASQNVENARISLEALIGKGSEESEYLDEFTSCWKKLNEIDGEIFSLAGLNTNVKAMKLSHGPAADETGKMEKALDEMMDRAADGVRHQPAVIRLAARAITDALNIYVLEAPHIDETTDTGMNAIEAKMKQRDERVLDALNRLDTLVAEADRPLLDEARNAYRNFQSINERIIALSRQNSNVRSFEDSIGRKREIMSLCLSRLDGLQEKIQNNAAFTATR